MTPREVLDRVETLFATRGGGEYHGEAVTQLEHALQAAALAEADGRPAAWVVAALLHDVGHLLHGHGEDAAAAGIDDRHEDLGIRLLAKAFGPEVTEPVRLHVEAKRYLCAARPGYQAGLSPASVRSLGLQGGPMSAAERAAFEASPHYPAAVAVRGYDDRAKVPALPTPPFSHFRPAAEACLLPG
jgi:phosphonate degradation associated HDIG domain protein